MNTDSLYKQFKTLAKGDGSNNAFKVISVPESKHKLGISSEGYPKFFVSTNDSSTTTHNIIREVLSVEYNQQCTIIDEKDNYQSDIFSIITLRATDEPLQKYFIDIFSMMLMRLPEKPSRRELSVEVENLITIFSAVNKKPLKEIQGLWAELLVIERSSLPETLISAWHNSPSAKYDFTMGRDKIEVKSTSGEEKIHRFTLDQLNPSPNSRLLIASVVVRESAECSGGLSIKNIYDKICSRVTAVSLRLKLYSILASTLGNDYTKLDQVFFDYVEASDSLAFYDSEDVPHIDKSAVPEFVNDVKFSSNLTHLIDIKNANSNYDYSDSVLFKSLF